MMRTHRCPDSNTVGGPPPLSGSCTTERAMLSKILTAAQDELLKEERRILSRLRLARSRFDAAAEHQAALDRSIEQLDELFLLVVIGEFNAGKSAFINALLGKIGRASCRERV